MALKDRGKSYYKGKSQSKRGLSPCQENNVKKGLRQAPPYFMKRYGEGGERTYRLVSIGSVTTDVTVKIVVTYLASVT